MDWFVNYWHEPRRATGLNLAVARVFVCLLAAWKVTAYPFGGVAAYPAYLVESGAPGLWRLWPEYGRWIGWEQGFAVLCLGGCACGLAPGVTAVTAAALIAHLTAVAWPVCNEKTWLPLVYFLLIYGIFRHEDRYVAWPAPPAGPAPDPERADTAPGRTATLDALKWFLVTVALLYFFAGLHKLRGGGWAVEWASPVNISRMLEDRALCRGTPLPPAASWLVRSPSMLGAVGFSTIALELGLLVAVVTNRLLTPCLLGLAAMHFGIHATMSVNYLTDMGAMYLVFVPWDTLIDAARGMPAGRPRRDGPAG